MWPTVSILLLGCLAVLVFWSRRRISSLEDNLHREKQALADLEARRLRSAADSRLEQESLLNSMTEGVLILGADGGIEWSNRSLREMFNLPGQNPGSNLEEVLHLSGLSEIRRRLRDEEKVQGQRLELPGKQFRVVQVNAARIHSDKSDGGGAVLVFHELTRIKEFETTRQEFVANVSHELRTPLALIKGYVETLIDGAKDDPERALQFLRIIDKHTDRLTFLIDDLLTISRLESGHSVMNLQHLIVHEVAASVISELSSRVDEANVTVENLIPHDLIAVADAERLHQVLFNLLENALKYGKRNGRVTIGARTSSDEMVEVWVRDDGPGIPQELRERVFERFYRVDKARSRESGGTGLGLSIVKHIVQAHGGEVWVRSEADQGSIFCFTLPREKKEAGAVRESEPRAVSDPDPLSRRS